MRPRFIVTYASNTSEATIRTTMTDNAGPTASVNGFHRASANPSSTMAPSPHLTPVAGPSVDRRCKPMVSTPTATSAIKSDCCHPRGSPSNNAATTTLTTSHADPTALTTDTEPRSNPV